MAPELLSLCQQMLRSGKPVTVGMLKAKAPAHLHLKDIISAVQFCKNQPDAVLATSTDQTAPAKITTDKAQTVAALQTRITL